MEAARELLQQVRDMAENPPAESFKDDALRRDLRDASRDMSLALEADGDAIHRLGSTVSFSESSHIHIF